MALYAIGDTHLSLGAEKPMDVFGGAWSGYLEKLSAGFSVLTEEDTLLIAGDVSWGMSLEEAAPDFEWLDGWPGTKILMKGNHDYWWNTAAKMNRFFAEKGFNTLKILHNNCWFYRDTALCGTRGWFYEEEKNGQKVFLRELQRLETSLKAAEDREKLCFLHYPPFYTGYTCQPILDLLERYQVKACYYGHLHGSSHRLAIQGLRGHVEYHMISADYLNFVPEKILD